jgi:Transposase and inactivated derivatives
MARTMTWIGLDVHARSVHVALVDAETGELRRRRLGGGVDEVVGFLASQRTPVRAVYEAGPTGFGLARAAIAAGVETIVVAPGKTPRAAADRVKTDQRDAELLVRLLMAGSLRAIHLPSVSQEAARDLVRAREALRQDLMRARHRVSKLLLRHGRVYPKDRGTWTVAHRDWLAKQRFEEPALELAYLDALASVDGLMARRSVLEQHLSRLATTPELWPTVARLRAFRGIDTLTALGLVTEIGDFQRFSRAPDLSAWLGLVPSIHQSGEHISRGGITKTGSQHARRLLVEAAWHYLRPPRVGQTLRNRQDGQPAEILQIAWRAQHRLYRTHTRLRERGKHGNVATVAAARELAGFVWAAATT